MNRKFNFDGRQISKRRERKKAQQRVNNSNNIKHPVYCYLKKSQRHDQQ